MSERPSVSISLSGEDMSIGTMALLESLDLVGAIDLRGIDAETGALVSIHCPDLDTAEKVAANLRLWHLDAVVVPGGEGTSR